MKHKFTDEEVIKALECCGEVDRKYCDTCPCRSESDCIMATAINALDFGKLSASAAIAIKDAERKGKEMERAIKAEAIKEFADRLKKKLIANGIYPVLVKNSMEKLLKEMTEEKV